jgi:hypothetical protein
VQHNLGDYGAPGTQIFGRATTPTGKINDFTGIGNPGGSTATGSPADIAAQNKIAGYRNELAASASRLQQPGYVTSRETGQARQQMVDAANHFNSLKPGTEGYRHAQQKLAAATAAHSALAAEDDKHNAFNQAQFGQAAQLQMHGAGLANQAIGYGVQEQGYKYNYDAKIAEINNQKDVEANTRSQQRLGVINDQLSAMAGGDKQLESALKGAAATSQFKDSDGKMRRISDLSDASRAAAIGVLQDKVAAWNNAPVGQKSLSGTDKNAPASTFGWIKSAVTPGNFWGTVFHGANQDNDSILSARPNIDDSREATEARQSRHATVRAWNTSQNKTPEGYAKAHAAVTSIYGAPAADRILAHP